MNAGISSRFKHAGAERGVEHSRSINGIREFPRKVRFAFCIKTAVKYVAFYGSEFSSRIVEDILAVILELGIYLR